MENTFKRFLSLVLALTLVIGMIPFGHVHAEDEETVVTFEKVTAVQANEEYVIFFAGTNRAMANSTRSWGNGKGTGMDTGVISAPSEAYLWTLVPVEDVADGYMLYNSAAAKYITISQNNAALSEGSGDVFKFTYTENGFVIKAEGVDYGYFNNLGGENIVGGWNSDGTKFDVCTVVEVSLSDAVLPGKMFWTEVSVDTETIYDANEGQFEYAWDNNFNTIWHSNWQGASDKLDTEGEAFAGEIDFGKEYTINWFSFTPRQGNASGQITQASLYVKGADDADWTLAGQSLTFAADSSEKKISFDEKAVRYVKFVAEASNDGWVAVSEFNIGYDAPDPVEPTDPTEPTDPVEPENAFTSVPISGITGTASSNDADDGSAVEEAFDGIKDDNDNYWASVNNAGGIEGNEYLIANLGGRYLINQVAYTRRTAGATSVGNLKDYAIWVSTDGETWQQVKSGATEDVATFTITFDPIEATHVKLTATQSHHWQEANLNKVMAVAEFEVFQAVCETHTPGEAATCTTAQTCTVCHAELAPATGHTWDNACDADCNTCGETREASHNYSSVVTEPTCTEAGSTTYTCVHCGDTYTADEVDALGHTAGEAVTENEIAATCTETGSYDTVVYCSVCNEEVSRETVTVPAKGHTYEAVVTAPTCTESGYTTYTCACGDSYTGDETDALGHSFTDGTCTRCGTGIAVNTTTGETYAVLADALAAAQAGNTIKLLGHVEAGNVLVYPDVILDLNGFELTADYVVGFTDSKVIDNTGSGKLIVEKRNVVLDENNPMIPLYDGNGYIFTTVGFAIRQDTTYTGEGIKIKALVCPQTMNAVNLLKNGATDTGVQIIIRLSWDTADSTGSQEFLFKDDVVKAVYASNKGDVNTYGQMFTMVVTGIENVDNLRADIVIVSDTNVERSPDSVSIN